MEHYLIIIIGTLSGLLIGLGIICLTREGRKQKERQMKELVDILNRGSIEEFKNHPFVKKILNNQKEEDAELYYNIICVILDNVNQETKIKATNWLNERGIDESNFNR